MATLAYQFFTGHAPTAAGLDYLVSPTGPNPHNLNSTYYRSFNLENRYINFAENLGKLGEGAAAFTRDYGALSLIDATGKAYVVIFGAAPSDEKVHAILDTSLPMNGQAMSRADYFGVYGQDGADGIGTKAAMVGWLMAEAEKAEVGVYARANDAFLLAVAQTEAAFGVDLAGTYGKSEYAFHGEDGRPWSVSAIPSGRHDVLHVEDIVEQRLQAFGRERLLHERPALAGEEAHRARAQGVAVERTVRRASSGRSALIHANRAARPRPACAGRWG